MGWARAKLSLGISTALRQQVPRYALESLSPGCPRRSRLRTGRNVLENPSSHLASTLHLILLQLFLSPRCCDSPCFPGCHFCLLAIILPSDVRASDSGKFILITNPFSSGCRRQIHSDAFARRPQASCANRHRALCHGVCHPCFIPLLSRRRRRGPNLCSGPLASAEHSAIIPFKGGPQVDAGGGHGIPRQRIFHL